MTFQVINYIETELSILSEKPRKILPGYATQRKWQFQEIMEMCVKDISGKNSEKLNPIIKLVESDMIYTNKQDIANNLNSYFCMRQFEF